MLSVVHALLDAPSMTVVPEEPCALVDGSPLPPGGEKDFFTLRHMLDEISGDAVDSASALLVVFDRAALLTAPRGEDPGRMPEKGQRPVTVAIHDRPSLLIEVKHDPSCLPTATARHLVGNPARLPANIANALPDTRPGSPQTLVPEVAAGLHRPGHPDIRTPTIPRDLPATIAALARAPPEAVAVVVAEGSLHLSRAASDAASGGAAGPRPAAVPGRVPVNAPGAGIYPAPSATGDCAHVIHP